MIRRSSVRWNNVRLRSKLLLLYFIAVFIPVILTNAAFYWMTAGNVRSQKIEDLTHALESKKDGFRKMLEGIIGFSSVLYTDGLLNNALDKQYASTEEMLTAYNDILNSAVNRFIPLNKQFYNAYLYTDNETLIGSGVLKFIDDDTKRQEWYRQIQASRPLGDLLLYTGDTDNSASGAAPSSPGSELMSVIRKLDYFSNKSTYTKLLRIDILPQYVNETLLDSSAQGNVYLLNQAGTVVYSSDGDSSGMQSRMDDKHSIVISSTFDKVNYLKGWRMIGIYPEHQVLQAVLESRLFVLYLTCANLLIPSLILLFMSRSLNTRIVRLLKQMKRVKNQRFEPLIVEPANDEIGQLTEEFNRMTVQIDKLIRDVYVAELDRKQAQLNALQSQINPHFLFNTLETIRMNSLVKNERETAAVIKRLARSFRRSLTWGSDSIPVREELEFITDFLEIQKFRFDHRLSYELHADDRVLDVRIPKMSILPIVENACVHGIECRAGAGLIQVAARLEETSVVFEVCDNGSGMDEQRVEALMESIEGGAITGDHVGLKNIYDRLRLYFDNDFNLTVKSAPGHGTHVTVRIPVIHETPAAAGE